MSIQSLVDGVECQTSPSALDTRSLARSSELAPRSRRSRLENVLVLVLKSNLACSAHNASLTTRTTVHIKLVSISLFKISLAYDPDTYGPNYKENGGNPAYKPDDQKPMKDKNGKELYAQGGYSSHSRVHEQFVFRVPDNIPSIEAAPMMCAGLTTYSPLKRAGTGPGKKVAIVGIGGLGHFGILWAKGLGAEVWAISHSPDKKDTALKLGADHFVSTKDKDWAKPLAFTFNFMLNAADMTNEFNIQEYMSTLAVNGEFHNVGLPDKPLPEMKAFDFAPNGSKMGGSHIGSKAEAEEMLKLASEKGIHPMIETIDISEAGCQKAVQKVKTNDVRYRVTLTGFHKAFGTS